MLWCIVGSVCKLYLITMLSVQCTVIVFVFFTVGENYSSQDCSLHWHHMLISTSQSLLLFWLFYFLVRFLVFMLYGSCVYLNVHWKYLIIIRMSLKTVQYNLFLHIRCFTVDYITGRTKDIQSLGSHPVDLRRFSCSFSSCLKMSTSISFR